MPKNAALLMIVLASLAAADGAAARPFMDSAEGHCFLCDLFSDRGSDKRDSQQSTSDEDGDRSERTES